MGLYINPTDCSKEDWLLENGTPLYCYPTIEQYRLSIQSDSIIVCLLHNPLFTAAGICFNEREFEAFKPTPTDTRPREWFCVPREK